MDRIQKVLANQGAGSRRQIDKLLQEGRIKVNGKVAKPGDQLQGGEKVSIDDKLVKFPRHIIKPKVLMYHKPVGLVSTRSDPEGRPTVYGQLPKLQQGRGIGVGRLDINTSGLLLFTTNGELANRLMHPSFEIEREYAVRVRGEVTDEKVANLTAGIELSDGVAKFDLITDGGGQGTNHWYHVTLREGKNREVRRLWEAVDVEVSRLVRVRYQDFTLPKWLKPGKIRFLDDDVVVRLFESLQLEYPGENKNKILKVAKARDTSRRQRRRK
ncbi:MAG: pseudouridine synthase [Gammaproteobacteria bacterium]|nr:pseudouridine synthase [Gammaproteobacteria bacterium]